ncbi:interleukin-10 receptor subunit beta [Boleophthalmus pectinirostris]|uniref:interleukin-10 receptor subunit beta n=1 Tax=Boleophthalmus pectinirostris TaxID=150288 RepID=UPI0024309C3D|nr:interleukin-10 receptor subunit beta [Boleophthalmus pectinirostris]
MAPAALLVALSLFLPCILRAQVPPPENLTLQAVNTDYSLRWTWPGMDGQTASFTVQCVSKYQLARKNPKWKTACEETSDMSCDLNPLDLHYLGLYTRVCATVNGNDSDWVPLDFAPAKDAAVGPPTAVQVSAIDSGLEISILEPQTNNNTSMKEKVSSLRYRFTYWEESTGSKSAQFLISPNTRVVQENLQSWTRYCVSVQSLTIEPNRTSTFTVPVCIGTNGAFSWGKICLIFFSCLFFVFLLVFGLVLGCFLCHRIYKNSFNPKVDLPSFLDEFLASPTLLHSEQHSELQCDLLSVRSPSPQQVPSGARDSIHSCSGDSGVSSNDTSTSAQSSVRSTQSSAQSPELSSGLTNELEGSLGLIQVQDIDLPQKHALFIADEGFGDSPETVQCQQ